MEALPFSVVELGGEKRGWCAGTQFMQGIDKRVGAEDPEHIESS